MVATTKPCKKYTVFAWQVLFYCWVYGGMLGPKQRVGFGIVECSLGVCIVYVRAEGCIVEECGKGVQFSLVELGNYSKLSEGSIRDDWGVLLWCRCEFLSYACAVGERGEGVQFSLVELGNCSV